MSTDSPETDDPVPSFELPNVGIGPDPLSLGRVVDTVDFAILLLLRDYHCPKCKNQVQKLAEEARQFAEQNAVVLPILPEPVERAANWQAQFELPFPLLADPEKRVADKYGQPTQLGPIGALHDLIRIVARHFGIDRTTACGRPGKRLQRSVSSGDCPKVSSSTLGRTIPKSSTRTKASHLATAPKSRHSSTR